ncbi:zinc finger C2HC domain-containing protein 1A isoform X1 [Megalops cyprinoides]|uniref:zinc finger C2HC domain-containing protein 1A isoform X1 n=1 Tax=Megalops cyprinoides TaxID=118141 RepID=UPI0018653E73|nr:zinc finger C2HC domain-containing protein 1A isoform X1 [Megalops cyprinoides]
MEDLEAMESPPPSENLIPCKICGRSFFSSVLKKHVPICQKTAAKKRKVFDSSRQRAEGTDIPTVKPLKPKLHSTARTSKSDTPEPPKKQSNWRRKHEEFIATIRAAKGLTQVMKEGGPLPPPPPPSYDPDYIQCPYCQRRFSENAADRHIKFCKEQAARISNKGKFPGDAKGKPPVRSQYKPPPVKKAASSAVSTVSSTSRLPQRSSPGQTSGGIPTSRTPSAGSVKSTSSGYSPSRTNSAGLTSPPSGLNMKSGTTSSPGSLKNTSGVGLNKRKVYNADNYNSRNHAKSECEVDYPSGQQTKFCHECGTKYPVDWAKFCCECGVRRMCI